MRRSALVLGGPSATLLGLFAHCSKTDEPRRRSRNSLLARLRAHEDCLDRCKPSLNRQIASSSRLPYRVEKFNHPGVVSANPVQGTQARFHRFKISGDLRITKQRRPEIPKASRPHEGRLQRRELLPAPSYKRRRRFVCPPKFTGWLFSTKRCVVIHTQILDFGETLS